MKKLLLAFAIATASLMTLNSCTKEYITNYLPGVSYTTTIAPNNWKLVTGSTNIYYAELKFNELDKQYYDYGTVQLALEFANAAGYYNVIPATIKNVHYSYDYSVGYVTVFAELMSGGTTADINKNIKAKITLTDADNGGN